MPSIHLLSKTLQNQIAAGEVVERPASVVKELVENSIDAHATQIRVSIEEGGMKEIRISDNGQGMDDQDAVSCFLRYATSKIENIDDLFSLSSFGFRGEAVAAIASVAHMSIKTKQSHASHGHEVINGSSATVCACPNGTETVVQNLFWNVPARKKFLKSSETETREIIKIMEFFAMSHPHIAFTLSNNSKEILHFPIPQSDDIFLARVQNVLGSSVSSHLLPIRFDGKPMQLSGFCSHPSLHRSTKDRQIFFVNGRMITKDALFSASIQQAYQSLLPSGKYPAVVISLTLAPDMVDVNVHPRKLEVKFNHPNEVFQILKQSLTHALSSSIFLQNNEPIHKNSIETPSLSFPKQHSYSIPSQKKSFISSPSLHLGNTAKYFQSEAVSFFEKTHTSDSMVMENEWKVIGQSRNSFIIVEEKNGIRIIDQHAAHERVRYEQCLQNLQKKQTIAQPLLTPIILSVSLSEKSLLLDNNEDIQALGFEIEDFGGNEVAVLSIPMGSEHIDIEKMFSALLADLDFFDPSMAKQLQKPSEKIISYMACRGAKKFGDVLSLEEMHALVSDWKSCQHPDACAHGRRVSVFYSFKDIENECGRY